ncbi:uncharacterized protein [Hemitrygon akajei]|uniref:uncharacterized protein n=1 Tax=Hemitrygon akajei TaxID=2704970 RepID=UPI003BF9D2AE
MNASQKAHGSLTGEPVLGLTATSAGSTSPGTYFQSDTTREAHGSASGEPAPGLSTTTIVSVSTATVSLSDTTRDLKGAATGEPGSDLESSAREQIKGSSTGGSTQEMTSVPGAFLDPETSTGERPKGSSTAQEPFSPPTGTSGERVWIKVQLTSSGDTSEEELRDATRRKLQEMFGDPVLQIKLVRFRVESPQDEGATQH